MSRLFWSSLVAAALVGSVAITLSSHVANVRDRALAPDNPRWIPTAIPLQPAGEQNGIHVQRLRLHAADVQAVVRRQEIDVLFATWGRSVRLARGSLDLAGCQYSTPAGEQVRDNSLVRFVRGSQCTAESRVASDEIVLTMRVPGAEPLAVWTFMPPPGVAGGELIFVGGRPDATTAVPILRGRYVDGREPSRVRRVQLLAYMWQISDTPYWIGGVLAIVGVLLVAGGALYPASNARAAPRARALVRQTVGAGCFALALGLLYAVLVPPFEAPDEPDHFLAFADLTGRPWLRDQAADLARVGHLERIKFHNLEKFRPADVGQPYAEAWNADIFPVPIGGRSRTTQAVWRAVGGVTAAFRAPATLLAIRVINAVLFGAAVAIGVALLGATRAPPAAATVFLLVPTLPFFAVHVSEFAVLTSTYVVFAAVVAALFTDGPRTDWLGLAVGLCAALMLAGGRSGAPMLGVLGVALVGRILLGQASDKAPWRAAAVFWIGATLGAALLIVLSSDEYSRGLWPGDAAHTGSRFRDAAEALRNRPWLFVAPIPAGFALEMAFNWFRIRIPDGWNRAAAVAARSLAYAGALALVAVPIASIFVQMPALRFFTHEARPPLRDYVANTLAVIGTSFRMGSPDMLLSTSFWGGFGWIDTILPDGVVTALVLLFGAMAVVLLLRIGRQREVRRFAWLGLLAGGWTLALVLYAVSSHYLYRNLHGRYLVGLYLSVLAVIWTAPWLGGLEPTKEPAGRLSSGPLLLAAAALVHGYALTCILRRYF